MLLSRLAFTCDDGEIVDSIWLLLFSWIVLFFAIGGGGVVLGLVSVEK